MTDLLSSNPNEIRAVYKETFSLDATVPGVPYPDYDGGDQDVDLRAHVQLVVEFLPARNLGMIWLRLWSNQDDEIADGWLANLLSDYLEHDAVMVDTPAGWAGVAMLVREGIRRLDAAKQALGAYQRTRKAAA